MRTVLLLPLIAILAGCDTASHRPLDENQPSASDSPSGFTRAEDAPGIWNEAQVRTYIADELTLDSVELKATGDGGYDATGQSSDGTTYTITIEQKPGGIRYEWIAGEGRSGEGAFGTMVEEAESP